MEEDAQAHPTQPGRAAGRLLSEMHSVCIPHVSSSPESRQHRHLIEPMSYINGPSPNIASLLSENPPLGS